MATTQYRNKTKASVSERVATDDQIFKKLNKAMNGLDKPVNQTATIQTHPEAIKPDGTVAQSDADIKLIQGQPERTPTGVLEYREEKENENFPIKVSLQTTKYEVESFYGAINENFGHFLQGFNQEPLVAPSITVTAGPTFVQEQVVIDGGKPEDIDQSIEESETPFKTAGEVHGKEFRVITEINSAGNFTGILANAMFMVWKGIRYKFYNGDTDTTIPGAEVHTTELTNGGKNTLTSAATNPGPIKGLTNSYAGRNLEVFLKERDMSYADVEILPAAEVNELMEISQVVGMDVWDTIQWNSAANDGFQYNQNAVVINEVEYEPGDIINPAGDDNDSPADRIFLPEIHDRWTEYHTFDVGKPAHRSLIYKPTADELRNKVYEGKPIRGYTGGASTGYYMIMEGEIYKISSGGVFFLATVNETPFSVNEEGNNNYSEYHKASYITMDWTEIRYLGTPGNKPTKFQEDSSLRVRMAQHYDGGGWTIDLPTGKWRAAGTSYAGFNNYSGFVNNDASYLNVPTGLGIEIYDDPGSNSQDFSNKTYNGPATVNLDGRKNDDISAVRVFYNEGIEAPKGYRGHDEVKKYFAGETFYKKPHLAEYNKLFE